MIYTFGAYTLDTDCYELRRAGSLRPLEPHAFDVLAYLLRHCDRVVTKQELLEKLWPDRFVGEGILTQRLMTIRRAIGDSGRSQHSIKTLHGRGYRFAAEVTVHPAFASAPPRAERRPASPPHRRHPAPSNQPPSLFSRAPHFVGRDTELTRLAEWWTRAQSGVRQVGLIVGEPGIGKTALVDCLVAELAAKGQATVGRGQCVDHYGTGEPYLPVLEALGRLCRGVEADRFASCLRQHGPSWLAHLPVLMASADRDDEKRTHHDVTPARMLRELSDALEVLTAEHPLVLVLEDLHWSDQATLEWLSYMARRRGLAHLLILGTYRPGEVLGCTHPLRPLLADLQPHAQCSDVVLEPLSPAAVAAYLEQRCRVTLPASLPKFIHERTGGHPLFLVALVDGLMQERRLQTAGHAGSGEMNLATLHEVVPMSLRQYIGRQLERLADEDQALLEAASVAGNTFAVAAVAAAVGVVPETLEERCEALARQERFIRPGDIETWPDGTATPCYRFRHAFYHELVYARVSAARRLQLHQRIAVCKEAGYGVQAREIAAELAVHFARGCNAPRAVSYLQCAAENALRRSAYQEAVTHITQGLEMLSTLPDTAERVERELHFLITLGLALVATKGQAHVDVEATYGRARALCRQLDAQPQLFLALWGLFSFYAVRAELEAARNVGEQLFALAEGEPDNALKMVAHWALGQTLLFQGAVFHARVHLEEGITLYDPRAHDAPGLRAGFPGDVGVFCYCFTAHTLWHLGYPQQARQRIRQALDLARELGHPFSLALALAYAAMLHQFQREAHLAHDAAQQVMTLCRDQGFAYYLAWGTILQGWALTGEGETEAGIGQLRRGLAAIRATGAKLRRPYYLALLAEAYGRTGRAEAARSMLTKALSGVRDNGECWYEAELHRLQGRFLLTNVPDAADPSSRSESRKTRETEAEQCFRRALDVAGRQQSKSLELRAAMDLSRLWQARGDRAQARGVLAPVYAWFTEGFDTPDLRDAKALLADLK